MREATIEKYLKDEVEKIGGECLKWVSPNRKGVPDRIVLLPGGFVMFIELKTKTGKLTKLQEIMKSRLVTMGMRYLVIDSMKDIDKLILNLKGKGYGSI